jgi:hypothetical protein
MIKKFNRGGEGGLKDSEGREVWEPREARTYSRLVLFLAQKIKLVYRVCFCDIQQLLFFCCFIWLHPPPPLSHGQLYKTGNASSLASL